MSWKGTGSSLGFVGAESRRWKQFNWQVGTLPCLSTDEGCTRIGGIPLEFGAGPSSGADAEIGGRGPQDNRVTYRCLCLMWSAPQWQMASGVRGRAQRQQGQECRGPGKESHGTESKEGYSSSGRSFTPVWLVWPGPTW